MVIEQTPIQEIKTNLTQEKGVSLYIKREDLNHPHISGNKLRKLFYNLKAAKEQGVKKLLTFGGAFSNHIYATAAAGQLYGFDTVGIIRGEEHLPLNPTLTFAKSCEMKLHYMDRTRYRLKNSLIVLNELKKRHGDFYLIPEGGTNDLAIKGCAEILGTKERSYDYYVLSVGTGGTLAGIIQSLKGAGKIIGMSALKGDFLEVEINSLFRQFNFPEYENWKVLQNYHFGGYAKTSAELFQFINKFEEDHQLLLDPVYTGKALYGIMDMIGRNEFEKGSHILFIHTGGIQGRAGFDL